MRWETYAEGSEVDYFAWWCSRYLIQSVEPFDGQPLILEDWQLEMMGEALAVDEHDAPIWSSVGLIIPRKNGKTMMLAAYALYRLLNDTGMPEILLAAASDKNAGRLFDAVDAFVRRNPELERQIHSRAYIGEIVRRDGGGKIIRLATDPTTLHGYNPSLVVCDELHSWTKPSLRKMWSALTTAGGSRTRRQVFTITTAGSAVERKTSILGNLLDTNQADGEVDESDGLTISRNRPGQTLIYNYTAPTTDRHDVAALKLANPASWITVEYLARQAANPEIPASDVLQFHGCVWAVTSTTWIDPAVFAELAKKRRLDPETDELVLAFDGSYSRDSTCLVGATVEQHPHVFLVQVWEKPPGVPDWRTPRADVFAAIEDFMERYRVVEIAPDPPGWHREIEELEQMYEDIVVRFETDQPRRMGPACDDFVQAVLGPGDPAALELDRPGAPPSLERGPAEMSHDGSEPLLRHLSNCVAVRRGGHTVVTKDDTDSPRKIDVAVGAIIAYHRAKWLYTNRSEDLGAVMVDTSPPPKARH